LSIGNAEARRRWRSEWSKRRYQARKEAERALPGAIVLKRPKKPKPEPEPEPRADRQPRSAYVYLDPPGTIALSLLCNVIRYK